MVAYRRYMCKSDEGLCKARQVIMLNSVSIGHDHDVEMASSSNIFVLITHLKVQYKNNHDNLHLIIFFD